jgi:tripartite-type tricarboxylate transporter receptor subunit TctC
MTGQWVAPAVLLITAGMSGAQAQDYPARLVTMIIPFAAGGPADITGRIVADIFSRHLGQKFVVQNVGGAGGTIGALRAACAAPDGYTILSGHTGTHALAAAFYPDLGYEVQKDFEPIGLTAEYPELPVVRKDFPSNTLGAFVTYAKANAGKLNVGHAGVGSVFYIGCLLLDAAIGIKPTMVPFTGTAPVLNAMLSGDIDYECDPVLGTLAQVAPEVSRRLRSPQRSAARCCRMRQLRTSRACPNSTALFYAVFVPKGTPKPIIVQRRLADLGAELVEPDRRGPKALADLVRGEAARLMPVLKTATDNLRGSAARREEH